MALYFFEFKHRVDRDSFIANNPHIEFVSYEAKNTNFFARTTNGEQLLKDWKGKPSYAWKE